MDPISLSKLKRPPTTSDIYKRADYWELKCLVNVDRTFGSGDFNTQIDEQADLIADGALSEGSFLSELDFDDSDSRETDEVKSEEDGSETDPEDPQWEPALDTLHGDRSHSDEVSYEEQDVIQHLRYRAEVFGDWYPFEVNDYGLTVNDDLTNGRRVYLFLLLASSLSYIPRSLRHHLTANFERISAEALRTYLPFAQVHVFGTSAGVNDRYSGTAWEKVQRLGQDLRLTVMAKESQFRKRDSGDKGIDIVAWLPFADVESGQLALTGQCACGEDWLTKQASSSKFMWGRTFHFVSPIVNVIFIPQHYRNSGGEWHNDLKMADDIVLFDRVRIIELLRRGGMEIPLPTLVDEVIHFVEPVDADESSEEDQEEEPQPVAENDLIPI